MAASADGRAHRMLGRTPTISSGCRATSSAPRTWRACIEVGYRIALLPRDGRRPRTRNGARRSRSAGCAQGYFAKHETLNTRDVINFLLFDARQSLERPLLPRDRAAQRARPAHGADARDVGEPQQRLDRVLRHQAARRRPPTSCRASARLDQGALGALPRRAAQHHPAQRHLLLQPARHLPRARRQHGAHPRRQVLRAAAARARWSAAGSTTCSGRAILRSVSAHRSYRWVYKDSYRPGASPTISSSTGDAALAALLLRRDRLPRSTSSATSTAPATAATTPRRQTLRLLAEGDIDTIFQSGLHEFLEDFIARNNRLGREISEAYHFNG